LFSLDLHQIQTLMFVLIVFAGARAILYLTRSQKWLRARPYPSRTLALSSPLDIAAVVAIALAGWLTASISIGPVAAAFGLAVAFLFVADLL